MNQVSHTAYEPPRVLPVPGRSTAEVVGPLLFRALRTAAEVATHRDFLNWLQGEVQQFVPHHTLVSCWGDFKEDRVSVDVTSRLAGVSTRALAGRPEINTAVARLHALARADVTGGGWCVVRGLHSIVSVCGADLPIEFYSLLGRRTRSLLVHARRCERAGHDVLYVFAVDDTSYAFDPAALDVLMPVLDSTLRTIKSLPTAAEKALEIYRDRLNRLSQREFEVIEWVSQGKSNEEIGAILGISRNTVKNHLKRIFTKMGVTARSQAVHAYMQGKRPMGA